MPEIKVGTGQREMVIHGPPRLPEGGMARTFLVGTVMDVAAEVKTLPQQLELTESCTLQVESAFGVTYGDLNQVAGIQTAVLKAGYEQSPYVPAGDDWGKLWHFKKGQRLLILLHSSDSDRELCFDPEELMVLDERTAALPEILRRTALHEEAFTHEDVEVLKLASPLLHQPVLAEIIGDRTTWEEEARLQSELLRIVAGYAALVLLGILTIRKLLMK
jgi:hypothetical protein